MHERHLTLQLQKILGMEGFVRLCQALGGTRLYVPHAFRADHDLVGAVGAELADKLSRAMAPATIRVPLGRRERALQYRAEGMSDAKIALQLGITENGVGRLFAREPDLPDRPGSAKNERQLTLL
jgi:hypothetical protein